MALLLDGSGFGVALRDDDAAQIGAVLAGNLLPYVGAEVVGELNLAVLFFWIEEYSPPVLRHLYVSELRPALRIHTDRRSQVHVEVQLPLGAHVLPPIDELRLPMLERPLQRLVARQIDIVGDLVVVSDVHKDS